MNFTRNAGIVAEDEQSVLGSALIALAGVGGDGGLVAEHLARLGVQRFRLADPEMFEAENLNRQAGSTVANLGRNKAEVIAEVVLAINPEASIEVFGDGVTRDNVDAFVDGADLVIDETEFTLHELGVMIARAARHRSIPVLTGFNVAFGCQVTCFRPDGVTLESFLGLDDQASLDEIAESQVPLDAWIRRLPPYIDQAVIFEVAMGQRPAPSVAPGVALTAAFVVTEAFKVLTHRNGISAPDVLWIDAMEGQLGRIDGH